MTSTENKTLNKIDEEFNQLSENQKQYQENYEYDRNCFCRRLLLRNTLDTLLDVRKKVKQNQQLQQVKDFEGSPKLLTIDDVPNLKIEDTSVQLANDLYQNIGINMENQENQQLTTGVLYKSLYNLNKTRIIFIIIFSFIEVICRLASVVLLKELLDIVLELQGQNIARAYIFAFVIGSFWTIGIIMRQNATFEIRILTERVRASLVMLIFKKISNISQYVAKNQELGKIINMLSNDFNLIQMKASFVFCSLATPLMVVGVIVILVINLGWPGVIPPLIATILLPIQFFIGKKNGSLYAQVNVFKDKRIKLCTQILQNIKSIKLYGWSSGFKDLIQILREQEIMMYIKLSFGRSCEMALGNSSVLWSVLICFVVLQFTDSGERLTGSIIFTTLEVVMNLRNYFYFLSITIGFYYEFKVIMERFCNILSIVNECMIKNPEKQRKVIQFIVTQSMEKMHIGNYETIEGNEKIVCEKGDIRFTNFDGFWNRSKLKDPTLKNINLHIKKGQFYGITGKIGSGKSGILNVLINQIPYYTGNIEKHGEIILVEQEPVIFSNTIKENILFGLQYDDEKYKRCLFDSCLKTDIEMFENDDQTIVGEKGVTLSGGQKVRLILARALYADADIYLFDDPISAVDSKVAKQIYENVILKLKGDKTMIMVTHQVSYLQYCDQVLIMDNGQIIHHGTFKDLRKELSEFEISKENEDEQRIEEQASDEQQKKQLMKRLKVIKKFPELTQITEEIFKNEKEKRKREQDIKISCKSYSSYLFITKINYFLFPLSIFLFLLAEGFNIAFYRLLAGYDDLQAGKHDLFQEIEEYWGIISLLIILFFIFSIFKYFALNVVILIANKDLHDKMIQSILRSECSFFDITSIGQLTNKFSNDLGIMDNNLAFIFVTAIQGPIVMIVMLVNIFTVDYFFIIPGVINIVLIIGIFFFSKDTIIKCKQLDLRMKTPVFEMVNEVVSGLVPIKVFKRRYSFLKKFSKLVNNMFRGTLSYWLTITAYSTYISYVTALLLMIWFLLGLYNIQRTEDEEERASVAGLYGASIIFLTYISDSVDWSLRQVVRVQSIMVSYERSNSITDLKPQKDLITEYDKTIPNRKYNKDNSERQQILPQNVYSLKLQNFSYRYRPQLPLVLKKINLNIKDQQKVGIVGRTGAGKSSIIQALFRISEPQKGSIYQIYNNDALKMGLSTLRHMISVIPQTPFLFSGTIRRNIDPENIYEEQKIWDALEGAGLKEKISDMPNQLQTQLANISQVFSVGQKQLVCLARAILRNNKFLLLDEATANVDMQTDSFIQKCIQTRFKEKTVITIAHRLNTVANYDRIIVMSRGRIIEDGSPHQLIHNNGKFAEMVNNTGKNAKIIKKIAEETHNKRLNQ